MHEFPNPLIKPFAELEKVGAINPLTGKPYMEPQETSVLGQLIIQSITKRHAQTVRRYLNAFANDMTTAELIGAYRKLVDTGESTDAEECALLDLLAPMYGKGF